MEKKKQMRFTLLKQGFGDILGFINTFGSPVVGAVEGYGDGNVIGAIAGTFNNLDVQNIAEFYADTKGQGRTSGENYSDLKRRNDRDVKRLTAENEGLMILKQSYQNEIDKLKNEMRKTLEE
jgi:hypothetical protein